MYGRPTQVAGGRYPRDPASSQQLRVRSGQQPLLPFIEIWTQNRIPPPERLCRLPVHTAIIKCFGSNVQLVFAGHLTVHFLVTPPTPLEPDERIILNPASGEAYSFLGMA